MGKTAFWICKVIRLYSCDLYLFLLLIFSPLWVLLIWMHNSVFYKLEQRITSHWYHWEHLYNFILLMKGECPLCPHYKKKLLSALYYLWAVSVPTSSLYMNPNIVIVQKLFVQGLPWWRSGWESACQCRGHGFEPWSGRIPHDAEQLGPWATAAEPARLEPVLRNGRGHDGERPTHRDEEWPPLAATRESPRTATKTQHSHK